ncbi:hypothetical protein [Streptomyces sp. NPDC015125]|uniref:hypothetical protein n=1 Tax=Streptomyces sp. NPDC015125 TaxID=3364938 RepID=UPI0036F894C9
MATAGQSKAPEQASASGGVLRIHLHGQLGRRREGTITTPILSTYVRQILDLQEAAATEDDLHSTVAQAIPDSHFTEWGTRADGLHADFMHVQAIEFLFLRGRISVLL